MGKASARRLAKDGPVLLCDINESLLEQTRQEFEDEGLEAYIKVADITSPAQLAELVEYATSLGTVKNVVHAAAKDFNTVEPNPNPSLSSKSRCRSPKHPRKS